MYVNVAFSCLCFCYMVNKKEKCKIKVDAGESYCPKRPVVLRFKESAATIPGTPPCLCSTSPHPWEGRLTLGEVGGLAILTGPTAKCSFKGEGGQTKGKKCTFSEHLCDK